MKLGALVVAVLLSSARPAAADLTLTRGGDWQIQVKAGVIVCALGQCQSDSAEDTDVAFLPAGSIVRMEAQVFSCTSRSATMATSFPASAAGSR